MPMHLGDPLLSMDRCPSSDSAVFFCDCYHDGPGLSVLMMCAESGQQFRSEALLVQEQISNIMEWVGMCSPGERRGVGGLWDQTAICHLVLVAMETNDYPWQHDRAHGM